MRITNAWIDDPTLYGETKQAQLCVEVSEYPDVTIEPESFAGGWVVGKYGPFVKYLQTAPDSTPSNVSASDFNVRFRSRFPVVVDITLFKQFKEAPSALNFSLPLTRARQLVRKYDPTWRLLVSDRAAEQGNILWIPVQSNPACRFWSGGACCNSRPAKGIRVNDVDVPLCEAHLREHNTKMASKRAAKAS